MILQIGYMVLIFVFGAIPFGFLISRFIGKGDIRSSGSGNIGATNVTRVLGIKWGLLSFILDFLKGFLPYWISLYLFPELSTSWRLWMSFPAIVGHNFSPFLGFKGGKGVSTTAGLLIAFSPLLGVWCFAAWLVLVFLFGYVSLASIVALLMAPALMIFFSWPVLHTQELLVMIVVALLGIYQHRSNIQRLICRKEKKMLPFSLFKL